MAQLFEFQATQLFEFQAVFGGRDCFNDRSILTGQLVGCGGLLPTGVRRVASVVATHRVQISIEELLGYGW